MEVQVNPSMNREGVSPSYALQEGKEDVGLLHEERVLH
jgi:hypothetical protein